VLSVGDQAFRQRCLQRIARMRAQGTAIVYVSHSLEEVRRVCDRVIWLKGGRLHGDDRRPAEVLRAYLNHTLRERGLQVRELGDEQERGRRFGSGEVEIAGAATLDEEGRPCNTFVSGAPFGVRLDYRCLEPVDRLAFGLSIYAEDGTWVTSPNSIAQSEGLRVERSGSAYYVVESLALRAGVYELTVSVFDPAAPLYKPYDHLHRAYSFVVQQGAARQDGLVEFPHRWLDGQGWERVRGQGKH
jgi:ABC-type glutathione transport system ATPase component